jgi:hypothetical protein
MDYQDRLNLFKSELELIGKDSIREFTKACIKAAPDYVFTDCPSSSTGKYHPIEELGPDGTVLHTKKVFALAYELSRGLDCENHRDEVCAAALLHDLAKQGLTRCGTTIKEHPQIMAKIVFDVYDKEFKDKLDKSSAMSIYSGVFFHYGPWTDSSVKKPITQYSLEELTVYLADYVSSKRFVHIDYKRNL